MNTIKFYSPITTEIKCCGEKYETSPQRFLSELNNALEKYSGELSDYISDIFSEKISVGLSIEQKNEQYYLTAACESSDAVNQRALPEFLREFYMDDLAAEVTEKPVICTSSGHMEEVFVTVWDRNKSFVLTEEELDRKISERCKLRCRDCKYMQKIGNTDETGAALCCYPDSYEPTTLDTACVFLPETAELRCGDCARFGNDFGCYTCSAEDSAIRNGTPCLGFIDKNEDKLFGILAFWKNHGIYNRERIIKLLDRFESEYKSPLD